MITIDVAEFSTTPFGRYIQDSDYSAEKFRETVLIPTINEARGEDVKVDFSKVALGVGSSFLEEAFGGLVRQGFDKKQLIEHLIIIDRIGIYDKQVKKFISEARS